MIKFYRKYQSIKKLNSNETEGINEGVSYIFPKIDGTNAQVWFDGEQIQAGSRNRMLDESSDGDNAGFCKYARQNEKLLAFFKKYPDVRLVGEWLVPHTLRTYEDNAWREFYVFDVIFEFNPSEETEHFHYMEYQLYTQILDEFDIKYIPMIKAIHNATTDDYLQCMQENTFLIKEGEGLGEGIVVKNYGYLNRFGRVVWAKLVNETFKAKHQKDKTPQVVNDGLIEGKIVNEFVTKALVDKEYSKIVNEKGYWDDKFIGRLLNTCYYCLITEELWSALKKHKNAKIDFRLLNRFTIEKVKSLLPDFY